VNNASFKNAFQPGRSNVSITPAFASPFLYEISATTINQENDYARVTKEASKE